MANINELMDGWGFGMQGSTQVNTTVAANIAVGSDTVTPASMTGIAVGSLLWVVNPSGTNGEVISVTAVAGTTFTATFTLTKTGPGIVVKSVSSITTPNAAASIWRMTNLNNKPWAKVPVNEDDRQEIGKGHEFPTELFKSHYNMPTYEISKYASSEFLAWVLAFALGNVSVAGTGPYTYTITPALGATNPTGLELPYFSFVQQIRPGGSAILDEILVGCAIKGWKLSIKSAPGRASAMCSCECVTTGQYTTPSGITLPAVLLPHEFNASMISALTINGINYLTGGSGKQFVSLDASWENNFRSGFFPGSGTQDGYQIEGRFEWGDRAFSITFVVRIQAGSQEYTNLINQTTGPATITFTRDANNSFSIAVQQMGFNVVELSNTDGIATLQVTGVQLYNATTGLVTFTVTTPQAGICQ